MKEVYKGMLMSVPEMQRKCVAGVRTTALLPPDHRGDVPPDYIAVPMKTSNGFVGLRVIIKGEDEATVRKALAFLRLIRIYPLSKSAAPPQSTFIDMADTVWDAVARFDDSFYESLARMVSEEPVQPHDAAMMGMLRTLGIDKGKDFRPDEPTRAALKAAALEAHAWFMDRLVTYGEHYWPDSKWDVPAAPIGPKSASHGKPMASWTLTHEASRFSASSARPKSWARVNSTSSHSSMAKHNGCAAETAIDCGCPATCRQLNFGRSPFTTTRPAHSSAMWLDPLWTLMTRRQARTPMAQWTSILAQKHRRD